MARRKKTAFKAAGLAEKRVAGLKSIDPELDFGNGVSVVGLETKVGDYHAEIENYNTTLSLLDEKQNRIQTMEKDIRDLTQRTLSGVATRYGKNSDEYEKAGGKRTVDRKRPVRKPKAA